MKTNLLSFLLLIACFQLSAQVKLVDSERFPLKPAARYNSTIPSPESFLGYELGAEHTVYADVYDYFYALAESSDRITINEYGKTYENRKLINLVITSEANHDNMDQLLARHNSLLTASESVAADIIENDPIFTSLSYNIHGNETSCTEAAMQVAYHMVAAEDPDVRNALNNSVIIMYVCINPDGRDRYVYWYKTMKRMTPGIEPRDLEHYAPWPNGRTNHYWFDLNRDWIWGIHPESRGHIAEYQKWMPQVHVDYHEQGYNSNYFTMPGTTPRNKLLPDRYEAWTDTFGRANIEVFDQYQVNYFTRDAFDFFFPSYGSSYPTIMGAIGMLTEQGGIGSGRGVITNDGYVLTLRQRVFDHFRTSLATINKSVERKQDLLKYSYESWRPQNSKTSTKAYCFTPESIYAQDVVNILLRNGVDVYTADANFQVPRATDFRSGETSGKSFEAGTFIVPTDQNRNLFITTLMERNMAIEDSVMYDMSTWSAPIAYNLDAYAAAAAPTVGKTQVTEEIMANQGLKNARAQYAYVIEWDQRNAPKALAWLWQQKYRVRAAAKPFSDGTNTFGAGSLIVLKGRNLEKKDDIDRDMRTLADNAGVEIMGFNTGRMLSGLDLASSDNRPLKQPKVALMVEPPFSTYTAGQIYFLFDWETQLPVERIRTSILQQTSIPKFGSRYGGADLNDYDVLILSGGGGGLNSLFNKEAKADLMDWVRAGGTIVATESAASFFNEKNFKGLKVSMKEMKPDSSEQAKYLAYEDREDYFGKKRIPGSALNGKIDVTHPLGFGLDPEVYSLKFGTNALVPTSDLLTVGHYDKNPDDLLVAGYASQDNLKHLAGGTFAAVRTMGRGKIVYLLDNTQYRMFWRGPSRMMQNAVMLVPSF
ncbi:MAG: M14 family zinc carboxypeptidase [Bacteroidota bacterium]